MEPAGAARQFGLARKTIRKMLAYSIPPGYERKKPVKPKLGPWLGSSMILEDVTRRSPRNNGTRPSGSGAAGSLSTPSLVATRW